MVHGSVRGISLLALAAAYWLHASPALGQAPGDLAARCAAGGGDAPTCILAAAAARDLMGDVAVLVGPGSEVPGQGSTLGRRIGGMPRLAPFVRVSGHSVRVPDLGDPTGTGETSSFVSAVHAGLGLGIFDGFMLLPTVGGFLSFDLVGQGSFAFFSEERGFDGRVGALSVGARVGLLRESFTLPGVTLSFSRRLVGSLRFEDADAGDSAALAIDPTVTSWRATVGKDLFAFGILGGVGWDEHSSDATVEVADGGGGSVSRSGTLEATRSTYFLGLTRQLGVLSWLAAEVGWTQGFDPVTGAGVTSPDPGRTVYGSLALLFKL
jgi:hypothetical protein